MSNEKKAPFKLTLPKSAMEGRLTLQAVVDEVKVAKVGDQAKVAVKFKYTDENGADGYKTVYYGYDISGGEPAPAYGEGLGEELARATDTLNPDEMVGRPVILKLANGIGRPVQSIKAA